MTFEKQVKEAKKKELENRIIRDAIFIILGIAFLVLSFLSAYKDKKDNDKTDDKKISIIEENSFIRKCI